jgi:hypothetical protein
LELEPGSACFRARKQFSTEKERKEGNIMEAVIDKMVKIIEKTIAEVDNSYCAHCLNHDLGIDIEYLKENRPAHFIWGVRDCGTQTVFDRLDISTFLYWTRENHYRQIFSIKDGKFRKISNDNLDAALRNFKGRVTAND